LHQIRSFHFSSALPSMPRSFGRSLTSLLFSGVAVLVSLPSFAQEAQEEASAAQPSNGPSIYVEYSIGLSMSPDQTLKGNNVIGTSVSGQTKQAPGIAVGGAIGLKLADHFRTELRLDYRTSNVNRLSLQGEPSNSKGDLRLFSTMANGYFDYDLGMGVVPYVGAGIGWGRIELSADNTPGPLQLDVSDTDSVFVWNVMVGGSLPLSEVTEVTLGYRYVETGDVSLKSTAAGLPQQLDYEFSAHEVMFGLRFNF
jgi:opacity protein-like surface antigen